MCITFFYINTQDKSQPKFLLVFNREENPQRSSKGLHQFEDDPNIIGGRDQQEGGTWFGVNLKTGNIAFLTNYSQGLFKLFFQKKMRSRGLIILDFLQSSFYDSKHKDINQLIIEFSSKLSQNCNQIYNPFNLILGNLRTMHFQYLGNFENSALNVDFSLSNFFSMSSKSQFSLNQTEREKNGCQKFQDIIQVKEESRSEKICQLMQSKELFIYPDQHKILNLLNNPFGSVSTIYLEMDWDNKIKCLEYCYKDMSVQKSETLEFMLSK